MAPAETADHPPAGKQDARRRLMLEAGIILLFWTVMASLQIGQRAVWQRGPAPQIVLGPQVYSAFAYFWFWALLTPLIFWWTSRLGFDRKNRLRRVLLHTLIGLGIAIVADVYQDYLRFLFGVGRRWQGRPFSPVEALLDFWWLNEFILYLAVLAGGFARTYFIRYQARLKESLELQAQTTRLRAQLAEARLQSLRMQLNPHFLFNTLHAVSSLVDRDPKGVRRMISRLSDLLRYSLEEGHQQEIPLQEEMRFLERYLEIEEVRFQGRLEVEEDIPPDVNGALVPSFILQPLVENAIKHGLGQTEGIGRIEISAWREDETLVLAVRDNGSGITPDAVSTTSGVGLRNTRERLEALYDSRYSMTHGPVEEGGFVVRVTLPYHTYAATRESNRRP